MFVEPAPVYSNAPYKKSTAAIALNLGPEEPRTTQKQTVPSADIHYAHSRLLAKNRFGKITTKTKS